MVICGAFCSLFDFGVKRKIFRNSDKMRFCGHLVVIVERVKFGEDWRGQSAWQRRILGVTRILVCRYHD